MKVKKQHPEEIAFNHLKRDIEEGFESEACLVRLQEFMVWDEDVVLKLVKSWISAKRIFKAVIKDEMCGSIMFFSLERPLPPVVKKIGHSIYVDGFTRGNDLEKAGYKTFAKPRKTQPRRNYVHVKRTIAQNSTIFSQIKSKVKFMRTNPPPVKCRFTRTTISPNSLPKFKRTK